MKNSSSELLPPGLLFSVAGARGIVGESLDTGVVARLTSAFCRILGEGSIVIGRDTRPSGSELESAAAEAIKSSGRECIELGIAATPTVELMVTKMNAAGGIIVTASHNPIQWNALKFLDERGIFISKEMSEKLKSALPPENGLPGKAGETAGRISSYERSADDHIDLLLSLDLVKPAMIAKRAFTVVLDCINGAGSVIAPRLLRELGVEVVKINCKSDGDFYRDPEPRPDNLSDLASAVERSKADLGFALDPDADRLALACAGIGPISEEYTLALSTDFVLSIHESPVVVNMSTSSIIERIAARRGVKLIRTSVGEAHVVKGMLSHGAVIGGEGNGGVIFTPLHPGRDGLVAVALILQFLAERGRTLGEQISSYPPFVIIKKKTPLKGEFDVDKIKLLFQRQNPVKIDATDGVRVDFAEGWVHVRVSNTEGVVRIIAEAETKRKSEDFIKRAEMLLEEVWTSH